MSKQRKKHKSFSVTVSDEAPRYRATLADLLPFTRTRKINPNGFLLCSDALLAREGVLVYKQWELPEKLVAALGFPEEIKVFRSLDTLSAPLDDYRGLPVTDTHPWDSVSVKDVTPVVGIVVNPHINGKGIRSEMTVFQSGAIYEVQHNDKSQLSLGYGADLVIQSGEYEGETYDVVQTAIMPNHVAIVQTGRCGPECMISDHAADTGCGCVACSNRNANTGKLHSQNKRTSIVEKSVNVVIGDEVVEVSDKDEKTVKTAAAQLKDTVKKNEQLQGEVDTLKAENERLTTELSEEKMSVRVNDAARVRGSIIAKAEHYLETVNDTDDNRAIMVATLKAHKDKREFDGRTDDYVQSAFDSLPDRQAKDDTDKRDRGNGRAFAGDTKDSGDNEDPVIKAQREFAERNRNRGKATA